MHKDRHVRLALVCLLFALLVLSLGCTATPNQRGTHSSQSVPSGVHFEFLNVGQGDSCLVSWSESSGKQFAVIDTGPPVSSSHVVDELKEQGCKEVRVLVLTHPHVDHYGGGVTILETFKVDEIWQPATANSTAAGWKAFENTAQVKGIRVVGVSVGTKAKWGSAQVQVLNPVGTASPDANNSSVVLLITLGTSDALLTGDAEIETEEQMANTALPDVELMKASHHGSKNGADVRLITLVAPDISIISVGPNSYGHPNQEAVSLLSGKGSVLRTDQQGDIAADLEPGDVRVQTEGGYKATVTSH
jgi:competence protein ComEC